MQFGIDTLQIFQRDVFAEQLLVERQREASVQVVAVEDRHPDDTAHEMEVT